MIKCITVRIIDGGPNYFRKEQLSSSMVPQISWDSTFDP